MQPSPAPNTALNRAGQALAAMRQSCTLDEFEEQWKVFLHRIERSWNKTRAHYGRSPKFGNWSARTETLRRTDPLLSYLCSARGAEEHTVAEITEKKPGSVGINLADGVGVQPDGSIHIEHIEFTSGPDGLTVKSAQPLKIFFTPAKVCMLPISNRGRTYAVPTSHCGTAINPDDLLAAAEKALYFYTMAVSEAEAYFIK